MEKVASRHFTVDYFEKGEEVWIAKTHLKDDEHDIEAAVEIDMSEMIITDASIVFNKFPLKHCKLIQDKAHKMIGIEVNKDFSRNIMKIFMGQEGCPNIMSLFNISIPGIIYYYYPYKLKKGKIKYEQWDNMIRTELKNDCLAHTLRNQN